MKNERWDKKKHICNFIACATVTPRGQLSYDNLINDSLYFIQDYFLKCIMQYPLNKSHYTILDSKYV